MTTLNLFAAPQQSRWHVFVDAGALESSACEEIRRLAQESITLHGAFHLVLAGGTTPRKIYERLCRSDTNWAKWHIYFGDERCLPAGDAERNSQMAMHALLDHVPIPPDQVHVIHADLGAEAATAAYEKVLANVPSFDLVLLGLGEDGHTASLFPGHPWMNEQSWPAVLPVSNAPKPPADRVSLSPSRLAATRHAIFLVNGSGKRSAVQAWRSGVNIPARWICPEAGVDVYLDAEAQG